MQMLQRLLLLLLPLLVPMQMMMKRDYVRYERGCITNLFQEGETKWSGFGLWLVKGCGVLVVVCFGVALAAYKKGRQPARKSSVSLDYIKQF